MTLFSLLLSAALFLWEWVGFGREYLNGGLSHDPYVAALAYIRTIFIFICAPSLWILQALKYFGLIPYNDMDTPEALQMKMFSWVINAILTLVFLWKTGEGVVAYFAGR